MAVSKLLREEVKQIMAREPFLINPPIRKRRSLSGLRKRRNKSTSAWSDKSPSWMRHSSKTLSTNSWKPSARRHKRKVNPFGEEVIVVGANPRRRKRSRSRSKRRNPIAAVNPRRRRRSRNSFALNPKRRRRKNYAMNPRRKSYRRHRRNPAESGGLSIKSIMSNPMALAVPVLAAAAGLVAATYIPKTLSMTTGWKKYGVQAAVALGGAMLVKNLMKSNSAAMAWLAGVGGWVIYDNFLKSYLTTSTSSSSTTSGRLGAFRPRLALPGQGSSSLRLSGGLGAFPGAVMSPYGER